MKEKKTGPKHLRWYWYPLIVLLVLALAFGAFLVYLTVTEYRPAPQEPAMTGGAASERFPGGNLRLLSFNTGYGGLGWESDFVLDGGKGNGAEDIETVQQNIAGIEEIILESGADVCLLQEVDLKASRTFGINELETYEQLLPDYAWYYAPNYVCGFVPYPLKNPVRQIHSGIATYSRFMVDSAERYSLPTDFTWPVSTANLKRCLLVTRIPVGDTGRELVIVNLHLDAYDDGDAKIAQTKRLLSVLDEEYARGNYVIAGGDFNQIFPEVETYVKETSQWVPGNLDPLPGVWRYAYDDSVPTCRLLNQPYDPDSPLTQHYVIDGFILSPNLEVESLHTLDRGFQFSDHNPVILDLKLAD